MKVAQAMVQQVEACFPDDSLNRAAQIMWERDCGCVPVVERNGRLAGIVTDRDICIAAYTRGARLMEVPVSSAMQREMVTCGREDDVSAVHQLMRTKQIRRLPVLDSAGVLLGIISISDIARALVQGLGDSASAADLANTIACISRPRHRPVDEPWTIPPAAKRTRRTTTARRPTRK